MSRIYSKGAGARKLFIPEKMLHSRDLSRCTKEQLMMANLAIRNAPFESLDGKDFSPKVKKVDPRVKNIFGIWEPGSFDEKRPALKNPSTQDAILTLLCKNKIKSKSSTSIGTRHFSTGNPGSYHLPQGPAGFPLPFRQENYEIHPGWQSINQARPPPPPPRHPHAQYPPAVKRKAEPLNPSNRHNF